MNILLIHLIFILIIVCIVILWRKLRLRRAAMVLFKQWMWVRKHAPKSKLVLEVGSGQNPFFRSDILCDKYILDDTHRPDKIVIDRPIVVGDALHLPFKNKVFDQIYSSHMIEHLEKPEEFFYEAGRVAKGGYFLAPSIYREKIFSDNQHLWFIREDHQELVFISKALPIFDPDLQWFFGEYSIGFPQGYEGFHLDNFSRLNVNYTWSGEPVISIIGTKQATSFVNASTTETLVKRRSRGIERIRYYVRNIVRSIFYSLFRSNREVNLEDLLACPICHGNIEIAAAWVICHHCSVRYPVQNSIPIMLIEHAEKI